MEEEEEEENIEVSSLRLIRDKQAFEKEIEERIRLGNEILSIKIFNDSGFLIYGKNKDLFLAKYKNWDRVNLKILSGAFDNPNNEHLREYSKNNIASMPIRGLYDVETTITRNALINQIEVWKSLKEILYYIPSSLDRAVEGVKDGTAPIILSNKIFIVHGHDEAMKEKVARVLEKLKLNPIILHEQPNGGKTIIEKLEKNSSDVGFAVILLTADDKGKAKNEANYNDRARQNVVFEMGLFVGLLGRGKVVLLLANGVEKPGDLDGVVYTSIDGSGAWKYTLCDELKEAGYNVDKNDI